MKSLMDRFKLDPPVDSRLSELNLEKLPEIGIFESGPILGQKNVILDNFTIDINVDGRLESKTLQISSIPGTDESIKFPETSVSYIVDELSYSSVCSCRRRS